MYGTVKSVPRQQAHSFVYHDPESSCGRFLFSVGVKTEKRKSTKDIDGNVLHIMLIVFKAFAHHLASFWVFLVADFFLIVEHYLLYDGL